MVKAALITMAELIVHQKYPVSPCKAIIGGPLWLAAPNSSSTQHQHITEWLSDSGATHHLFTDRNFLFVTESANLTIKVANSDTTMSKLKGNYLLETNVDGTKRSILLTNVFFCESLAKIFCP
ncbi:hypothetical protein PsorP6_016340 [Peronosclerospora sorghi]|uniref:Uncharacterized protein n=1 Tax=Peronosclerospora sorghi TaxID=230839 RepID=A0ACC0VM48_9STRA|nr:hypothetical protein PsorP6_016340 [Peronosclerospora sorghi]